MAGWKLKNKLLQNNVNLNLKKSRLLKNTDDSDPIRCFFVSIPLFNQSPSDISCQDALMPFLIHDPLVEKCCKKLQDHERSTFWPHPLPLSISCLTGSISGTPSHQFLGKPSSTAAGGHPTPSHAPCPGLSHSCPGMRTTSKRRPFPQAAPFWFTEAWGGALGSPWDDHHVLLGYQ